jgi:hypothetical protein
MHLVADPCPPGACPYTAPSSDHERGLDRLAWLLLGTIERTLTDLERAGVNVPDEVAMKAHSQ